MSKQIRLGEFWLAWRTDRKEWAICWNDRTAGTRRRKSVGVGDYNGGNPPVEAQKALADHFAQHGQTEQVDSVASASTSRLLMTWLSKEGSTKTRSVQYAYSVRHLQRWIDRRGSLAIKDISPGTMKGFIEMRLKEGVSGETIRSDLAALKAALTWGVDESLIPYAPRAGNVPQALRSGPREIEYSIEQIAALLEAAASSVDREHVHLFTMIMLSTHARVEAVLELDATTQIRRNLIHFNAPGRTQTSKRRPIVPIAPALQPWLPQSGKVIMYRKPRRDGSIYARPTHSIKTGFAKCLLAANIVDREGKPWGSPNALRHSIHTYLQTVGVPQAQIDAAAGHVTDGGGTGKNYTHLRPEYLKDFLEAVEAYWGEMDQLTRVHRSQVGPKVYDLGTHR